MPDREKVINHFTDAIEASGDETLWRLARVDIIEDAIALLKEQEPVEPRWTHPTVYKNVLMCGNCGIEIPLGKPNYCPWCGRKVNWDD